MNYLDLTDDEVLDMVGTTGPAIVGHYLHERSEYINVATMGGRVGPESIAPFVPSDKAMADLASRGMVVEVSVPMAPIMSPDDGKPDPNESNDSGGSLSPDGDEEGVTPVEWTDVKPEPVAQVTKRGPGRPRKEK